MINGIKLQSMGKNLYAYQKDDQQYMVTIKGNLLSGLTLNIGNTVICMSEKPAWYEIALPVLMFVFILIWGNVPYLFNIIPTMGGVIGGIIAAVFAFCSCIFMKRSKNIFLKILIFIACFAVAFILCWLIALAILSI